jgi:hypothetical protein
LDSFRSRKEDTSALRPVLRELLVSWDGLASNQLQPVIIMSGTGLNYQDIETAISSVVAKGSEFEKVTETGAFVSENEIDEYMDRFIPEFLSNNCCWKELRRRCLYWLAGR